MNLQRYPVNLKKYLPFFRSGSEQPSALGIFSNDGSPNLLADEGNPDEFAKLVKHIESSGFNNVSSLSNQDIIDLGSDGIVLMTALMLPQCESSLWLVGLIKCPGQDIGNARKSKAIDILRSIACCIVDDYNMQQTLTETVNELTVRYEELNLLYGIDDPDTNQNQYDEEHALRQLINNCSDYMSVDLVAIYAPELSLSLHKSNSTHPDFSLSSVIHTIQNLLYQQIASTQETVVINHANDINWWSNDKLNSSYKFIIAPIMLSKHHLAGILAIANSAHKPDFSNSDRKLFEVLASEAGKLIKARRDNITGLSNRRGFTEKLQQTLTFVKQKNIKYSLLFVDIDQFKIVNDTSGQIAGDQLLNHIGSLISKSSSHVHTVGRLGADEFGVILENCGFEKVEEVVEQIRQTINQFRFAYKHKLYDISTCIGAVELSPDFDNFSVPLNLASLACNVAKGQGRNRVHINHPSDDELVKHENEMQWVSRIHLALEEERFQIYRQKIQPLKPEQEPEEHYEILLRLKDEEGKLVPPFNFIPAAERYNLMPKLDRWVVKNALAKMAAVLQKAPESRLSCSINLSGQSFCEPGFIDFAIEQIIMSGISPNRICFEITETAAVSNLSQTVKFIETLKSIGCFFSLDDFGSGMSSFTYLKTLPVNYIKIDGYFVKSMLTNSIDYAMVKSIHEIGKVMGLKTIAEFVENDQILQELTKLGVDYGQGYGIAKPEPFE